GTWQFLAIRLLEPNQGESVVQDRIDDVESFYHLLLWMALRYTAHILDSEHLTSSLRENFDASYRDREGKPYIGTARIANMKSGHLIDEAHFANAGIESVLQGMRRVLCERYTDPKVSFKNATDSVAQRQRELAEVAKEAYLKTLENPQWLTDLFREVLDNKEIDWEANRGRVNHKLMKPPKFATSNLKRKTESGLHPEGSRKVSRKSGTTTPQDNRSGPN
ncbi:hypothetical protein C0995_002326, partial [Termitomyces sp. Mi166